MKQALLSLIVCPDCFAPLEWVAFGDGYGRVDADGLLSCRMGHRFPVIQGIPRFLGGRAFDALRQRYAEYFRKYELTWPGDTRNVKDVLVQTIERFGFEWTQYSDYKADNFSRFLE